MFPSFYFDTRTRNIYFYPPGYSLLVRHRTIVVVYGVTAPTTSTLSRGVVPSVSVRMRVPVRVRPTGSGSFDGRVKNVVLWSMAALIGHGGSWTSIGLPGILMVHLSPHTGQLTSNGTILSTLADRTSLFAAVSEVPSETLYVTPTFSPQFQVHVLDPYLDRG